MRDVRPKPSPTLLHLPTFLPFQLAAVAQRVTQAFVAACLAPYDLTAAEWRVLCVIGTHDGISATETGHRVLLDKVKVSRVVAALVGRKLLRQTPNAQDKRARNLSLTPKGRALVARIVPSAHAFEAALIQPLSARDLAATRNAIDKLAGVDGSDGRI